jgi:uncharacterized protein
MIERSPRAEPTSLLFNVSGLLKSEIGQFRSYDFEFAGPLELEDGTADDIHGQVKFMLTNFGVLAHIHADGLLHLTCSRCLSEFATRVETDFEEEFVPSIDIQTGLPAKTPRSDSALPISPNHTIDLGEAIRQEFLLSIDLIPLCSPTCRGLCPTCGADLNAGSCSCPPPESTSPFAALVDLIQPSDSTDS